MVGTHPPAPDFADYPLWRLLVMLADLEREYGPDSPTARVIARVIAERLGVEIDPAKRQGVRS